MFYYVTIKDNLITAKVNPLNTKLVGEGFLEVTETQYINMTTFPYIFTLDDDGRLNTFQTLPSFYTITNQQPSEKEIEFAEYVLYTENKFELIGDESMELSIWKIRAYVTLVKAGKYILDESEREFDYQIVVEQSYKIAVAEHLIQVLK